MSYVLVAGLVVLLVLGTALAIATALCARVLLRLVQQGPAAAEAAFQRGDSIGAWWTAAQTPTTLDSPRDNERLAFSARIHSEFGEVLVEERASFPSYGR